MPKPLNVQDSPSSSQKQFIKHSIQHNIRIDGRSNLTKRKLKIKTNALPHLIGSSYVFYEYQHVQAYTGIKIKLEQCPENIKQQQIATKDRLIFQINAMGTISEQQKEQLIRAKKIIYSQYVEKLLNNGCVQKFISIPKAKKHYLSLYIDTFILGPIQLSNLQMIVTGVKEALLSMKTNVLEPTINQVTEQEYIQITNNEISIQQLLKQNRNNVDPLFISLQIVGLLNWTFQNEGQLQIVVDMRHQQYQSMDCCLVLAIWDQKIIYLESLKGLLQIQTLNKVSRVILAQKQK